MPNSRYLTCPKDDELLDCVGSHLSKYRGSYIFQCPKCKKRYLRKIKYIDAHNPEVENSVFIPLSSKQTTLK